MMVNDVVQQCVDSDDDYAECDYDPDEPVMEGSDDEFSDFEGDESDEDIDEGDLHTMHTPAASSSAGFSSSSGDQELTWSTTIKRLNIQPFTSPVGPTQDISSPLEVFDLSFSPDLIEKIVKESNAYANVAMGNEKYDKWSKITVDELRAFLGFSVLMGINHLPSLNDYWSRDPRLRYASVADCIT